MSEPFDWKNGVVAIMGRLPGKGRHGPVGAGFIVSPDGLIATCAHVVQLTKWPYGQWGTPIQIRFNAARRFADALVLKNCFDAKLDVAILSLMDDLPKEVVPLPLSSTVGTTGHTTYMWGYPAKHEGLRGEGRVLGLVPQAGHEVLQLRSTEVTHGYSGGPVWDEAWDRVIGMILSGTEADSIGRLAFTAFALPAETLVQACPPLSLTPPAEPRGPDIPLQLPPRADHFTGREDELARLLSNVKPGLTETIVGPGGMGKSALAAEVVWRLHESGDLLTRFPDGLIFHTFYNQPEAEVALEHIARSFYVEPTRSPTAAARRALSGKKAILLLDGTEAADDLSTVLSVRGACGALITTRKAPDAPGELLPLESLLDSDAITLLGEWAGSYAAEDAITANDICELLGRLPLAVSLAGRYMKRRRQSAESYLAWLRETPLEATNFGDRQSNSIPVLMERSLGQVGEKAHDALAVAGLLALAPVERAAIAAALKLDEGELRRSLDQLLDLGLLSPAKRDRVQVSHALIRTYARERLDPPDDALNRLAAYYQALVDEQNALGATGHARLELDRPHLMALLRRLSERGTWRTLFSLADPVEDYLDLSGRSTERIETCSLAFAGAREAGDRQEEGRWLDTLAGAHIPVGRLPEAVIYYEEALAIHRDIGHRSGEGYSLNGLGNAYYSLGRYAEAVDYYVGALTIAREIGDRRSEASWLGNLGNAYSALGRYDEALDYHHQALAISRDIGDRRGEGNHLGNLGNAYKNLGEYDRAIEYYNQALIIDREIGDRLAEGNDTFNLGLAYLKLDRVADAKVQFEQALEIYEAIKSPYAENARQALASLNAQ